MMERDAALGSLWRGRSLIDDFHTLCSFGGRLAGTESEFRARDFIAGRMKNMVGEFHTSSFQYTGRIPIAASLRLVGDSNDLSVTALPGSPSADQLRLPLVNAGLGTEEDFEALGSRLRGAAVLVQHDYPFYTNHMHRRRKYGLAKKYGCKAFLIANNVPSIGPVAGGCASNEDDDIPGVGISFEAGTCLARASRRGTAEVLISVSSQEKTWEAANLVLDIRWASDDYVLIGAHLDGHELAQSAMDNATGVAASVAIAETFGLGIKGMRKGLRLVIFDVEERGLVGSRHYVQNLMSTGAKMPAVAIILDSITGYPRLSALTGGNHDVEELVGRQIEDDGTDVDIVRPILRNSDHYNFQCIGVPSMRLVAGYGNHASLTRLLLTPADTEWLVEPSELKAATMTAASLVYAACSG